MGQPPQAQQPSLAAPHFGPHDHFAASANEERLLAALLNP